MLKQGVLRMSPKIRWLSVGKSLISRNVGRRPLALRSFLRNGEDCHRTGIPPKCGVHDAGKAIFILGICLTILGAILWKTGGLGGLGRLPGDIFVQKGNTTFSFPIVTCIIVSLVLTLLGWLFRR